MELNEIQQGMLDALDAVQSYKGAPISFNGVTEQAYFDATPLQKQLAMFGEPRLDSFNAKLNVLQLARLGCKLGQFITVTDCGTEVRYRIDSLESHPSTPIVTLYLKRIQ